MLFKKVNKVDDRKIFLESLKLNEDSVNSILEAEDSPDTVHVLNSWEELFGEDD